MNLQQAKDKYFSEIWVFSEKDQFFEPTFYIGASIFNKDGILSSTKWNVKICNIKGYRSISLHNIQYNSIYWSPVILETSTTHAVASTSFTTLLNSQEFSICVNL